MRAPLIAATLAVMMAAGAQAQTAPPAKTPNAQPPAQSQTKAAPTQEAKGPWFVKDFFRSRVYNMAGERIGDVNDLVVDDAGKITGLVVGVGGFLGLGEKEVSLSLDQAKRMVHSDGKAYFTVNMTKDQLQSAPAYEKPKT